MAIFLPVYPVFFLSPSFVGPGMPYIRCVRVVSVLGGVSVLLNVHRAPQFLQLRYHIYYILPLIIQKKTALYLLSINDEIGPSSYSDHSRYQQGLIQQYC